MNGVNTSDETPCAICNDTGWRSITRGKEREVVRCECRLKSRSERLLTAAKIPPRYEHCDLGTFKCDQDDKDQHSLAKAKLYAGRFVEEYPTEKTGLLFVGSVGVGKTHLAVGILKALIRDKGVPCLFCDYRELLKSIQNSFNASVQATEMGILRPVFDAEVLVLDELGASQSTEWVRDTVNYVINTRYNQDKTTIITTNFPDEVEHTSDAREEDPLTDAAARRSHREQTLGDRIGNRMRSRLHEMCKAVLMSGPDFRLKSKRADWQPIAAPSRIKVRGKKESG
jgi:DNA replication protein DnaC